MRAISRHAIRCAWVKGVLLRLTRRSPPGSESEPLNWAFALAFKNTHSLRVCNRLILQVRNRGNSCSATICFSNRRNSLRSCTHVAVLAEDLHSFIEDLPLVRTRNNNYNLRRILSTRVFAAV